MRHAGLFLVVVTLATGCSRTPPQVAQLGPECPSADSAVVAELRRMMADSAQVAEVRRLTADAATVAELRRMLADTTLTTELRRMMADTSWVAELRTEAARLRSCWSG
jgi:hypothetical protein